MNASVRFVAPAADMETSAQLRPNASYAKAPAPSRAVSETPNPNFDSATTGDRCRGSEDAEGLAVVEVCGGDGGSARARTEVGVELHHVCIFARSYLSIVHGGIQFENGSLLSGHGELEAMLMVMPDKISSDEKNSIAVQLPSPLLDVANAGFDLRRNAHFRKTTLSVGIELRTGKCSPSWDSRSSKLRMGSAR